MLLNVSHEHIFDFDEMMPKLYKLNGTLVTLSDFFSKKFEFTSQLKNRILELLKQSMILNQIQIKRNHRWVLWQQINTSRECKRSLFTYKIQILHYVAKLLQIWTASSGTSHSLTAHFFYFFKTIFDKIKDNPIFSPRQV